MNAGQAKAKLHALATPEAAKAAVRFFKVGPGQYGEADKFIGVRVPAIRKLTRELGAMPLAETEKLLRSPIHEERLLALLILVLGAGKGDERGRKAAYDLYTRNIEYVNNWDLVDCSAPTLVGGYLADKSRKPLIRWAKSSSLWKRRIAVVATQHFIRRGEYNDTLAISRLLLADEEDLVHKATGWMLREVGERDEEVLTQFLDEHAAGMPRTMLRYATEKLSPEVRRSYRAAGSSQA